MINTKIEWTDYTWSPWLGCSKVSEGCKNCYIVTTTPFRTRGLKHGQPRQRTSPAYWRQPLRWQRRQAASAKRALPFPPRNPRVFPSLCDWLDDEVPIEWLADFLKLIFATPNLDWLLLTKRPENCLPLLGTVLGSSTHIAGFGQWLQDWIEGKPPHNVWLGVSVENQATADLRIPQLLQIPANVRFLSVEPLIGPVNLRYAT